MKTSLVDRFWDKFERPEEGCWNWNASKDSYGYGYIGRRNKSAGSACIRSHRLSWMLWNGPIPDGMCICHKCDNPSCVNPDHLFLGSHKDNMQDMFSKERRKSVKGENHGLAKLTNTQAETIKDLVLAYGMSGSEASRIYGLPRNRAHYIVKGKLWRGQ